MTDIQEQAVEAILASFHKVGTINPIHVDALRAIVQERVEAIRAEALWDSYLAARGTHKLNTIPKIQQYWRGRSEAAADIRVMDTMRVNFFPEMLEELASKWDWEAVPDGHGKDMTTEEAEIAQRCATDLRTAFNLPNKKPAHLRGNGHG